MYARHNGLTKARKFRMNKAMLAEQEDLLAWAANKRDTRLFNNYRDVMYGEPCIAHVILKDYTWHVASMRANYYCFTAYPIR